MSKDAKIILGFFFVSIVLFIVCVANAGGGISIIYLPMAVAMAWLATRTLKDFILEVLIND